MSGRLSVLGRLAALLIAIGGGVAQAQQRVHGSDSRFSDPTIALLWAVERDRSEDKITVVIRALNRTRSYRAIRVEGVDPFSTARIDLVPIQPFPAATDLRIARARFAEYPSCEIHFYLGNVETSQAPHVTVFYLGVPDTTPEFASAQAAKAYLDAAQKQLAR